MMRNRLLAALTGVASLAALFSFAGPVNTASADGGYIAWPKDKVYVVDYTNSTWPVNSAIETLDNNSPLDLVRVTKCPSSTAQCVDVRLKDLPGDQVGLAEISWMGATDIVEAHVTLDGTWGKKTSSHNRRADVCHEVGHAIGLNHVKTTASCMNPIIADNHSDKPSAADYTRMRAMY